MRLLDLGKSVVAEFGAFTSGWTTAGEALCDGLGGGPGIHGETMFGRVKSTERPSEGSAVVVAAVEVRFRGASDPRFSAGGRALCGIAASCGDHPVAGATRVSPSASPRLSSTAPFRPMSSSVRRLFADRDIPPRRRRHHPLRVRVRLTLLRLRFSTTARIISRLLHDDEHPERLRRPLTQTESELHRSMSAVDLVRTISSIDVSPRVVFEAVEWTPLSKRPRAAHSTRLDHALVSALEPPSPRSNAL